MNSMDLRLKGLGFLIGVVEDDVTVGQYLMSVCSNVKYTDKLNADLNRVYEKHKVILSENVSQVEEVVDRCFNTVTIPNNNKMCMQLATMMVSLFNIETTKLKTVVSPTIEIEGIMFESEYAVKLDLNHKYKDLYEDLISVFNSNFNYIHEDSKDINMLADTLLVIAVKKQELPITHVIRMITHDQYKVRNNKYRPDFELALKMELGGDVGDSSYLFDMKYKLNSSESVDVNAVHMCKTLVNDCFDKNDVNAVIRNQIFRDIACMYGIKYKCVSNALATCMYNTLCVTILLLNIDIDTLISTRDEKAFELAKVIYCSMDKDLNDDIYYSIFPSIMLLSLIIVKFKSATKLNMKAYLDNLKSLCSKLRAD